MCVCVCVCVCVKMFYTCAYIFTEIKSLYIHKY